jgi:putative mRNA 3-end processing factor
MPPYDVARRPRIAPVPPVTWRDGVHLTGTPIWCDARRRRDVCFVSSAERVGRVGHGQLIATPATLALLGADAGHLAVPVHRPFTLGTTRLELIPSGRGLGAAALHVDLGGRTVLYAGAIRTVNRREAAEVRACEAVVVDAGAGDAELPPLDDVASQVVDWVRVQLVHGHTPVLVVDTVFDGIEVAEHLAAVGLTIHASRTIRDAAQRARAHGRIAAFSAPGREPAPVIRLESDRVKLAATARGVTALVSIRAAAGLGAEARSWDATFAWPFVAGREQLLHWIEQSRAKHIFLTGSNADAIADELGPRARVLGPPRQMALFGS